jgi:hypothetical protein
MKATLANMKKLAARGHQFAGLPRIEAASVVNHERCSACPSDHWYLDDKHCLSDSEGFEMVLIEVVGMKTRRPR